MSSVINSLKGALNTVGNMVTLPLVSHLDRRYVVFGNAAINSDERQDVIQTLGNYKKAAAVATAVATVATAWIGGPIALFGFLSGVAGVWSGACAGVGFTWSAVESVAVLTWGVGASGLNLAYVAAIPAAKLGVLVLGTVLLYDLYVVYSQQAEARNGQMGENVDLTENRRPCLDPRFTNLYLALENTIILKHLVTFPDEDANDFEVEMSPVQGENRYPVSSRAPQRQSQPVEAHNRL